MELCVKYEPKFSRVIIKREVKEKIGSILLPDSAKKRHAACKGTIVALGETAGYTETPDGKKRVFEVGDNVIFGRHSGAWLDGDEDKDDGTLYICQDEDILVTIKE